VVVGVVEVGGQVGEALLEEGELGGQGAECREPGPGGGEEGERGGQGVAGVGEVSGEQGEREGRVRRGAVPALGVLRAGGGR